MSLPTKPVASDRGSQMPVQFDVYSQLLKNRIVMLWDAVDDDIAKSITANAINKPPTMLINDVLVVSTCSAFTDFIFFLLLLLFVMTPI